MDFSSNTFATFGLTVDSTVDSFTIDPTVDPYIMEGIDTLQEIDTLQGTNTLDIDMLGLTFGEIDSFNFLTDNQQIFDTIDTSQDNSILQNLLLGENSEIAKVAEVTEVEDTVKPSNDIITLNVGGIKYETYCSTLKSYPETFLGTMFSERNKEMVTPREGRNKTEFFFDRSGELFKYILQFYRTGKIIIPPQVDPKEMEIELDFFQIPRPESSTIDKIAILKVNELVKTFKNLIKEVAEYYVKKNSFRDFEAGIDICFLDNGQATVKAGLDSTLTDTFESSKHFAYNIMSVYKNEIKNHLEKEYPELTWTDEHKSGSVQYYKIKLVINWKLDYYKILQSSCMS